MVRFESATPIRYGFFEKAKVWFFGNPVFIYTMGKVGSSTVAITLREYGVSEVQPHSLRYSVIGSYFVIPNASFFRKIRNIWKTGIIRMKTAVLVMKIRISGRRVKVVTMVREPVSRNISAFFEQFQHLSSKSVLEYSTKELIDMFWLYCNHDAPLNWFERELEAVFGVDICSSNFDKSIGCSVISHGLCDVLVLKMEKISELDAQMSDFFEIPNFEIASTNRSEKKHYANAYKDFKSKLAVPEEYLDRFYKSKYVTSFYTEEEIKEFYLYWLGERR